MAEKSDRKPKNRIKSVDESADKTERRRSKQPELMAGEVGATAAGKAKKAGTQVRVPQTPGNIGKRGVGSNINVDPPVRTPPEEAIKAFGPLNVEVKQCQTAIIMLQSLEQHIVIEALNSIQKFCKKRKENKHIFVALGGISATLKLIFHEHQVIQRLALKALALTSIIHHAKLCLRNSDACKNMCVLAVSQDEVIQEYASFILSSLATLYTGRLELIHQGATPVLMSLLSHADPDIQKNAANAIWRILHEPMNIEVVTSATSIAPVLKLCDSQYPELQHIALSIIMKITTRKLGIEVLEEYDMIQNLGLKLKALKLCDLHRLCLRILINMAVLKSSCLKMIPILVFIIQYFRKTKDLRARAYCLKLIGRLSKLPSIAKSLVDLGLTRLIAIVIAGHPQIQIRGAGIFAASQLAAIDFRAKQRFCRCIKQILAILQQEPDVSRKLREHSLLFFSSVLEDGKKSCPKFIKHNGLELLSAALEDDLKFSNNARISAMACISYIAQHFDNRRPAVEAGLVRKILECLERTKIPQILTAGGSALSGLLCDEGGRKQFIDNHGHENLIKLVSHEEFPVVISAVPIIHVLGSYAEEGKQLVENGLLQAIWKRQDLISTNGPLRTAFERLLCSHLPAKFAIAGHIDPFEKLQNGFYDCGNVKKLENFVTLSEIVWADRDPKKRVLYLNTELDVENKTALENNKSLKVMIDEGQTISSWIEEIRASISEVNSEKELVRIIASVVSEKMGGHLDKWRIGAQAEDLELGNIQSKYESVVVPITMIATGAHRPRSIAFKAIADAFGIPCSLERGDYKKAWNVVLLQSKKPQKTCSCHGEPKENIVYTEKLRRFVVDLVHQPGAILALHSYEANAYCFF